MKELKQGELEGFVKEGKCVVDFWAPWCGPCKMLLPVLEEVSEELKDYKFAKANVDDLGEEAMSLSIRGVPTLIFFNDGKEISRVSGFLPKDALTTHIEEVFK